MYEGLGMLRATNAMAGTQAGMLCCRWQPRPQQPCPPHLHSGVGRLTHEADVHGHHVLHLEAVLIHLVPVRSG